MELEGTIQEPQFLRNLVEMGRERFTGAVRLERDDMIKILYLQDGNIISASTNDPAESVDEILLRAKKINREHIQQALVKRKMAETLGDILLSSGFISRKELRWARRHQIISVLRSAVGKPDWNYTVVPDYVSSRSSEGTAFPVEPLLIELVVTDPDRSRVEQRLAGGEVSLRKSPGFDERYPQLGLNEDADRVTKLVDGKRTASAIAAEAGGNGFMNLKLLAALHVLGVLEINPKAQEQLEISFDADAIRGGALLPGLEPTPPIAMPEWEVESFSDPEAPSLDLGTPEPSGSIETDDDLLQFDENGIATPSSWEDVDLDDASGEEAQMDGWSADGPSPADVPDDTAPASPLHDQPGSSDDEATIEEHYVPGSGEGAVAIPRRTPRWRWFAAAGVLLTAVLLLAFVLRPFFVGAELDEQGVPDEEPVPIEAVPGSTTIAPAEDSLPPEAEAPIDEPAEVSPEAPVDTPGTADPDDVPADLRARFDALAQEYSTEAVAVPYTVQFEIVCETSSVALALEHGASAVWFVPIEYGGRSCYRVFWGRYEDPEAARQGIAEIPQVLRGSQPVVVQPGRVVQ